MTREDKLKIATNEYIGYPHEVDEDIAVSLRRAAFTDGANWQYQELIKKDCKWLEDCAIVDIEEFKKAMEE